MWICWTCETVILLPWIMISIKSKILIFYNGILYWSYWILSKVYTNMRNFHKVYGPYMGYSDVSLIVKLVWYIALFLRFENPLDMRMLVTINSHGNDLPLSVWQILLIIYKMPVSWLTLRVLRTSIRVQKTFWKCSPL